MGTGFVLLAMIVLSSVMIWAFFSFSPEYADKKAVSAFNWVIVVIIAAFCITFSFKGYAYLEGSRYIDFLPLLLFLANMMILALGLLVGFLARNYYVFSTKRFF